MVARTEVTKSPTPRNQGNYESPHMTPVTPAEDIRTVLINRISWGAVTAGIVMALTVHLVLNLLGIGIGIAAFNPPVAADALTATAEVQTISFGAMMWWTVAGILSALAGGFTAGRLAGEPKEATAGWHGLTSWAGSVLIIAVLVSTAAGTVMGGNMRVLSQLSHRQAAAITNTSPAAISEDMSLGYPDYYPPSPGATTSAPMSGATVADASTTADAKAAANALAGTTLIAAIALILGAIAAWFGGRAGAVKPTMTDRGLRYRSMHH